MLNADSEEIAISSVTVLKIVETANSKTVFINSSQRFFFLFFVIIPTSYKFEQKLFGILFVLTRVVVKFSVWFFCCNL